MKTIYLILPVITGLTLAFTSCSDNSASKPLPKAVPIVLKDEYRTKTVNNRSFALDFFKTMVAKSDGENLFVSPYSVNTALNMLWNGAGGETADEMRVVLGNGTYSREQINDYAKTLTEALLKVDPSTELKIANSIWADNLDPFKPTFVKTNRTYYNAEVKNVDFSNSKTLNMIDRWCLDNTNNKIDRISEGMTVDTKFALINAVYFKGKWEYKFNKSDTKDEVFSNADGTRVTVQMMNQNEDLFYADDDKDWKMMELPYGNGAFSMIILMPYSDEPLDGKLATLTADKFYSLFDSMNEYNITVKLPKFKAKYGYELQKKVLPAMGLNQVFDPLAANLGEMCETPMYVNLVMHKTYIDVYEEGTEAAAATAISGEYTSAGPGKPINFFVDRPFIYSIVENSTGTILFMGRMNSF